MMNPKEKKTMIDPVYSIVFSTAFLGSGHCIGMCGPIVTALSLTHPGRRQGVLFHLFYNAGRLTTYMCIGMLAGWIGHLLNKTGTYSFMSKGLLVLADLFVIAIGLRTTGLFKPLAFIRLEFLDSASLITKMVSRLRELPPMAAAFPVGLVMGFLPCGFLYAIALAAAGRGSVIGGGLIMLAFGLGTIPALFLFGSAIHWLSTALRTELLRWAGFMVVFIGCYNLYHHILMSGLL